MARVKRGTISMKRRRNILQRVKGYRFGRSTKERQAREAISHAGVYAFRDRRKKKGLFRRTWQMRTNAASRINGLSYSKFMGALKKNGIALNRKMLAELGEKQPEVFARIVETVK